MTEPELLAEKQKLIDEAKIIEVYTLTEINKRLIEIEGVRKLAADKLEDILSKRRELFKHCPHSNTVEGDGPDRGYIVQTCQSCGYMQDKYYGTKHHTSGFVWFKSYRRDVEENKDGIKKCSGDYC